MRRILLASALFVLLTGMAEAGFSYRGSMPPCDEPSVLNSITDRYRWANDVTWHTGRAIANVDRIQETRFVPGEPGLIDRRYCRADVRLNTGHDAHLYYMIEQDQGFASIRWGVEFCLPDQDPWRVYDAACRTIR